MKTYPSIPKENNCGQMYVFDKLDGSNLRFEWVRRKNKTGEFVKFGTRTRLFDQTDEVFGCAINIFTNTFAEKLEKMSIDERWESVVFFGEFYGKSSFAGMHLKEDEKFIKLFDISPFKKGILGPKEYLRLMEKYQITDIAAYLGTFAWNKEFIEEVYNNNISGISFEGVIGKSGDGHKLLMSKAKTKQWIEKVKSSKDMNEQEIKQILDS